MQASRRASGYDFFKLTVAIFLLILFLILFRQPTPPALLPAPTALFHTATIVSNSAATVRVTSTQVPRRVSQLSHTATLPSVAETQITTNSASPTFSVPTVTASPIPTATETWVASQTPVPSSPRTPIIELTTTPAATPVVSACEAANSRSQLQAGTKATILRRLNFRSSPGIRDNWLLTNIPGTQVEIISGPQCVPYWTGAYLWWQIKLPDGHIGWSAEDSLQGTFYFMEPSQ